MRDPDAQLENEFIDQFIATRGYERVDDIPADERQQVMQEASIYAAGKLAEGAARHIEREHMPDPIKSGSARRA